MEFVSSLETGNHGMKAIAKNCFSGQQAQKSYSTKGSERSRLSAVSANKSARSHFVIRATLFTWFPLQSGPQLHKSNPSRIGHPGRVSSSRTA